MVLLPTGVDVAPSKVVSMGRFAHKLVEAVMTNVRRHPLTLE